MIKDFEVIKTERINGMKAEILEHIEHGEDVGFLIAKIDNRFYKIGLDGLDRNDYKNGYYTEIKVQ